jgi:hypothetical protein
MEGIKIIGGENIVIKDDFAEPFITRGYLYTRIHEEIDNIINYLSLQNVDEVIKLYVENYDRCECNVTEKPLLSPIEPVGKYYFKNYTEKLLELTEYLKDYVIVGYDSSYHNPRGHFLIDFVLHNIGYYYEKIASGKVVQAITHILH